MKNNVNYIITATSKQIELLTLACNQAMRVHIGQLDDPLTVLLNFEIAYHRHHEGETSPMLIQEELAELSRLCWHNMSYGYGYDEISKNYYALYRMFKGCEGLMSPETFKVADYQLELLRTACEPAARLRAGQLDYGFIDELMNAFRKKAGIGYDLSASDIDIRERVTIICNHLHTLCWNMPPNADYGMHYDDESDIWWDMFQVFRHQLWLQRNPNPTYQDMMTVDSDKPYKTGKEPLVKVDISS